MKKVFDRAYRYLHLLKTLTYLIGIELCFNLDISSQNLRYILIGVVMLEIIDTLTTSVVLNKLRGDYEEACRLTKIEPYKYKRKIKS